ncbi:50S ribosomal protein L9 [Chloroflexota bacterium]
MKVVFLKDVSAAAKAGDIKEVSDGYARNFLIPNNIAAIASAKSTSQLEAQIRSQQSKQAQVEVELAEMAAKLEGLQVSLKAKVGTKDRLYGSITSADIAVELEKVSGIAIDKRKIELSKPIHQLGSFDIAIKLGKDVQPKIKVVVAEMEPEDDAR